MVPNTPKTILITGGARSGKSLRAETLALSSGLSPLYVATAQAFDGEMSKRIAQHQERRGDDWQLVEEQIDLPGVLGKKSSQHTVLLVDCLTLWLSNLMFGERDIERDTDRLCHALLEVSGPVVLVTNEVGLGIVPDNKLSRDFRDHQGRLNQRVAEVVDAVEFVVAGQPVQVKPAKLPPLSLKPLARTAS